MMERLDFLPDEGEEEAALAAGGEGAAELELTAPGETPVTGLAAEDGPPLRITIIPAISEEARDKLRAETEGPRHSRMGGMIQGPSGMISGGRKGRGKGTWDDK